MNEMRKPDDMIDHSETGSSSLLDEVDDDELRSLLTHARTAWRDTVEPRPNGELRAFLAGAAHIEPAGSRRPRDRWSTTMITALNTLWPPTGRTAFAATLVAVVAAATAASVGLGANDPVGTDPAATATDSTTSTMTTVRSTGTTPTTGPTSTTETTTSSTVATPASATPIPPDRPATPIVVADAGTVEVAVVAGVPILVTVDPAAGWRVIDEHPDQPNEIDLSFRRGEDRVDLDVEVDDGQVRVRVRDRRTDSRTETYLGVDGVETHEDRDGDDADMPSEPDGLDDNGEDDSGSGNAEDRDDNGEDNSGSGNAEDRDDDGEDNSGSGNAEDRDDSDSDRADDT